MLNSKLFQFYDSPIKSTQNKATRILMKSFQFYDSPIKSGDPLNIVIGNLAVSIL